MKALEGELLAPEPMVVMQVKAKDLIRTGPMRPEVEDFVRWINAKDVTPR